MHEALCLPCISGCCSLPSLTIASSASVPMGSDTGDETAHYLICPILVGIISEACYLDYLPNLHGHDVMLHIVHRVPEKKASEKIRTQYRMYVQHSN